MTDHHLRARHSLGLGLWTIAAVALLSACTADLRDLSTATCEDAKDVFSKCVYADKYSSEASSAKSDFEDKCKYVPFSARCITCVATSSCDALLKDPCSDPLDCGATLRNAGVNFTPVSK